MKKDCGNQNFWQAQWKRTEKTLNAQRSVLEFISVNNHQTGFENCDIHFKSLRQHNVEWAVDDILHRIRCKSKAPSQIDWASAQVLTHESLGLKSLKCHVFKLQADKLKTATWIPQCDLEVLVETKFKTNKLLRQNWHNKAKMIKGCKCEWECWK